MSLTKTTDAFGRESLSTNTAGSSFAWSKSIDAGSTYHAISTTGTGALVDNRANKNYKWLAYTGGAMTFVFTGVEFAIYGKPLANRYATITIDGTPHAYTVQFYGEEYRCDDAGNNQLLWGISGLANTEHTVTISSASGGITNPGDEEWEWVYADFEDILSGIWYSTLSASIGATVRYKVVIDGTTTETLDVVTEINRVASRQSIVNRLIAGNGILSEAATLPLVYGQHICCVAGAYAMTNDSRLISIASSLYDAHMASADGTSGFVTAGNRLTEAGRNPSGLWYAYTVFKTVSPTLANNLLALADKQVTYLVNTWPKTSGIWNYLDSGGSSPVGDNHITAVCYSCALLYHEPDSDHYHSTALYNAGAGAILTNAEWAVFTKPLGPQIEYGWGGNQGLMHYSGSNGPGEFLYACGEWTHLRYLSEKFAWRTAEINLTTEWIASSFSMTELYFYQSEYHNYTSHLDVMRKMFAYYKVHGSISSDLLNAMYSAAFDHVWQAGVTQGTYFDAEYRPDGFTADTAYPKGMMISLLFEAMRDSKALSIPYVEWYEDIPASVPDASETVAGENPVPSATATVSVPDGAEQASAENPFTSAAAAVSTPDGVQLIFGEDPAASATQDTVLGDFTLSTIGGVVLSLQDAQGNTLILARI